jgi:hypothetical protein
MESHKKEPVQEYMGCLLSVRVHLKMKHHLCSGSEKSQVTNLGQMIFEFKTTIPKRNGLILSSD